jgi:hypothetical protein
MMGDSQPFELKQVELFSPGMVEAEIQFVASAKEYLHTGKIVGKDEEKVRRVVEMTLMGASVRQIKRACGVGYGSILKIRELAVASGKLGTIKERLASNAGRVAEMSSETMLEMLAEGKVPPNVIAVMFGVSTDKMMLLMGEATTIVEHKEGASEEKLRAWAERIATMTREKRIQATDVTVGPAIEEGGQ